VYPLPRWPLPVMWTIALYCYVVLRQSDFRTRESWRAGAIATQRRSILALFFPAACLLSLLVYAFAPQLFLSLLRRQPLLWGGVILLYPVFSVVPQTFIYRAFIFNRYQTIFPSPRLLILASAVSFSWMHIVLRNPLAPLLTFPA